MKANILKDTPKNELLDMLSSEKEKLSKMIEKKDWGMIWCI